MNKTFTLAEMVRAESKAKTTSLEKDPVCYFMQKKQGEKQLLKLLDLCKEVWMERSLPCECIETVVIPIRKPDKDPSKPRSYRPKTLTSDLCKIIKKQ